jgi:hypothetical protein
MSMRRFTRLTNAFSKKLENLQAAVALHFAHYNLALLWQILSGAGFPNQFFNDSWVVGFWRGRPWLAERWIGKKSLDVGSSRFWIGWVIKRGGKCARSTYRG